ncbi:glycosyltransferase family 2 protein [Marinobacter sp.]|uniref:glycosyltransferase family 2 protein n=1 Tax=Marinobacter sp. TaxID=50741 RepID=UPI001B51C081|nr:glycosyltransferase family 2 protein [Marinobacter sp.]MBQ0831290.1 glycosyltransferase family 2 protein [Marinobacter sp.]
MSQYEFSVVIATFNRPELCAAAVESVFSAAVDRHSVQVIVVDDASGSPLPRIDNPHVQLLKQDKNAGPGPARMRGIREADSPFVIILDDDDQLRTDAFATAAARLAELPAGSWLVAQFATSNAGPAHGFRALTFDDYMCERVQGDYTPVFHREQFLASGLAYPETRIGGEHLLWWALAERVAIPTWQDVLIDVGADAAERLTGIGSQVSRAREHLDLAEETWRQFGTKLKKTYPLQAARVSMGGVTYAVLAGQRLRAFAFFSNLRAPKQILIAAAVVVLPRKIVLNLFQRFRSRQRHSAK